MTLLHAIRKLLKGSSLRVVYFFSSVIVAFYMVPFTIRALGDQTYGLWIVIVTFIGYYELLDFGLSSALMRYISGALGAENKEECNRFFNTAMFLFTGLGTVALIISAVFAFSANMIFVNPEKISLFWKTILVLGVHTSLGFPFKVLSGLFGSGLRFDMIVGLQLMTMLLRNIAAIVVLFNGYGILALALVTLLSGLPEKILYLCLSKKLFSFIKFYSVRYWDKSSAKKLFKYSLYTFLGQMGDLLRLNVGAFIIASSVNMAAVTHYSIASELGRYFVAFTIASVGVFQPLFSMQHRSARLDDLKATFFFATKLSIYVTSFVGFGLIFWGKSFVQLWMGVEYLDAYPCLVILCTGLLCELWQTPSVSLLYGTSKHNFYALFNAMEGVMNVFVSILLVKNLGIVGVALGVSLPMMVSKLLIQPIYVCRVTSMPYYEYILLLLKASTKVLAALALPFLISWLYVKPTYSFLVLIGTISLCFYTIILLNMGFTDAEKSMLYLAKETVEPS